MNNPPDSLCILRLSALGDVSHVVPVVRTLQAQWPNTSLTWVIGKMEYKLVKSIEGVEFVVFDKAQGWAAYQSVWKSMRGQRFDVLLHMQAALRASILSLGIKADQKVGFDRRRARDMQWLFSNKKIPAHSGQHVLDSFFSFIETLGIAERVMRWDIPIDQEAREFAATHIGENPTLIINPCASARAMNYRNWRASGYAAVADYANKSYGFNVIITGGSTAEEIEMGRSISELCQMNVVNLVGETTIQQLLALLDRASVVVAPDTGPAHMASAVGTPTIGLYITTNPDRARPYNYPEWVVNRYPEAVEKFIGKRASEVRWGTRVRNPEAVDLIGLHDVIGMLDKVMAARYGHHC